MAKKKKRDPNTEALIGSFVDLIGPGSFDLSDREVEAEMAALKVKISHERIRQYRADKWEVVVAGSRRKIRTYMEWKTANPSAEDATILAEASVVAMGDHRGKKVKPDAS